MTLKNNSLAKNLYCNLVIYTDYQRYLYYFNVIAYNEVMTFGFRLLCIILKTFMNLSEKKNP